MKITRRRQALLRAEIVALRSARRPGAQRLRLFARDRIKPGAFVYPWALRPGTGRAPKRATSRRAAAAVVRQGSDQTCRLRVFVSAATGDQSRTEARDVPSRSGCGCSPGIGSNLSPSW